MFTFSFGSAFAATDLTKVVETKTDAVKAITDKAEGYVSAITAVANEMIRVYVDGTNGISKASYTKVVNSLAEEAIGEVNADKVDALNELEKQEKALTDADTAILGYIVKEGTTADPGYIDVVSIISSKMPDPNFTNATVSAKLTAAEGQKSLAEEEFNKVKTETMAAIQALDLSVYSATADSDNDGVKDYDEAVEARRQALVDINGIKVGTGDAAAAIMTKISNNDTVPYGVKDVFRVTGKGTAGEKMEGTLGAALNALKKTTTELTDSKKLEYAKTYALADSKGLIEKEKARKIGEQNQKIFAQELSSKPDQKVIDKANKEIEKITKEYDALLEVVTYRLENSEYEFESVDGVDYINTFYDTDGDGVLEPSEKRVYIGAFVNNNFTYGEGIDTIAKIEAKLSPSKALEIATYVDELQEEAKKLTGSVAVDGDVAVNVEEALATAVEKTYMTGEKARITTDTTNYEVHNWIHELLGEAGAKVTVDGKSYPTVYAWEDKINTYDDTKADEVYDILYTAEEDLKEAKTIADANAIFLAAYEKFDAVMTDAEHDALFVYGGALYDQYSKAAAEINAYVGYKADVMGDTFPGTEANLKAYFTGGTIGDGQLTQTVDGILKSEVYSAADLDAKVAEAKATIDALSTKAALKEKQAKLNKDLLAVAVPVKIEAKDSVVALYNEISDFIDYCDMVGYSESITLAGLPQTYVKALAEIEKSAMDDIVDEIYKDNKITLADKALVEQLADAADAYNDLYYWDLEVVPAKATFDAVGETTPQLADYFENEIFKLEVKAAEELLKALPANGATTAQIKEAKAAVDALGFDGICLIDKTLLTKLNRLDQNLVFDVEALKITASSTAKKGSITVKWTVKGNEAAADGYQIWKSTKKNSGFKKAFTTTKKSYKNTKGLKKGTRYYYKVRAYKVVDGKNIYSDWSNKAYRKAK